MESITDTFMVYQSMIGLAAAGGAGGLFLQGSLSGTGMPNIIGRETLEAVLAGGAAGYLTAFFYPSFISDGGGTMKALLVGAAGMYVWNAFVRSYAQSAGVVA
jgi:hypothetical protein